jgi:hypothetical protein
VTTEELLKDEKDEIDKWKAWIVETCGSTADAPIERGEQGSYEIREPLAPART